MLKIRLRRMGSRQDPLYRVVVSESTGTPQGRFVDALGTYDPGSESGGIKLDVTRTEEWIRKGAHPSQTVRQLLDRAKILQA